LYTVTYYIVFNNIVLYSYHIIYQVCINGVCIIIVLDILKYAKGFVTKICEKNRDLSSVMMTMWTNFAKSGSVFAITHFLDAIVILL